MAAQFVADSDSRKTDFLIVLACGTGGCRVSGFG